MEKRNVIVWDEVKSNRLYDYVAENPPLETSYFGYQVGQAIINFVKCFESELDNKKVLDYGCGCGHILEKWIKEDADVYGVDMSEESVKTVNSKFKSYDNFKGALVFDGNRLPYENNFFDIITCTEVIEHILEKHMQLFLSELYRILKPDGIILFTTPNDEVFAKNYILCPNCNTLFHKHGHCNKFNKESLSQLLEKNKYKSIICDATDFWLFQQKEERPRASLYTINIAFVVRLIKFWIKNRKVTQYMYTDELFRKKIGQGNNLFFVGTKENN